jgi:hypothetical protein
MKTESRAGVQIGILLTEEEKFSFSGAFRDLKYHIRQFPCLLFAARFSIASNDRFGIGGSEMKPIRNL